MESSLHDLEGYSHGPGFLATKTPRHEGFNRVPSCRVRFNPVVNGIGAHRCLQAETTAYWIMHQRGWNHTPSCFGGKNILKSSIPLQVVFSTQHLGLRIRAGGFYNDPARPPASRLKGSTAASRTAPESVKYPAPAAACLQTPARTPPH